jgi:hypothetical protein
MHDFDELAQAYFEFWRLFTAEDRAERLRSDGYHWALEEVDELVEVQPSEAVPVLVALADAAPDEHALGLLGAGDLENLINHHGSDAVIDAVVSAARRNPRFRKALTEAWYDEYVSPEVCARLRAFGGRVRRPDEPAIKNNGRKQGARARSSDEGTSRNERRRSRDNRGRL